MKLQVLADVFEKVEGTTKRLEMTDLLVNLMKQTPSRVIDKVAYLTIGEIYPPYVGVELGVAEKLAVRAIAAVTGLPEKNIAVKLKKTGDLGLTVQDLLDKKTQQTLGKQPLTVERTYQTLEKIAHATGSGSQETKIKLLVGLLNDATPREAKYILRIVLGRLRLGVADMTLLDALAIAYGGGKESRETIERAYNLTSDIGYVAKTLAKKGMKEIEKFAVTFGKPIKPQMAERLASLDEILEKLGGEAAADYKYDGLRIQAQVSPSSINLFSRRQENITDQFPDIVKGLRESIKAKEAIVDGEAVPIDPNTGDFLPFQVISQRRGRRHEIDRMVEEVPVALCLFDALYIDDEDLTLKPYPERRKRLEKIVRKTETIRLSETIISNKPQKIEAFFNKAVHEGTEGLILKSVGPESIYEAGKRGWLWIKWKRSYRSEMADTVDLVVVGAFSGRGRRAGTYGALLMAAYNPDSDRFDTVCKLGSGFTDEDLARLPELFKSLLLTHPHPRVNALMKPDFWFIPSKVLEVLGDEITLSPLHTCGFGSIRPESGLAIRFPRLVKFRDDRAAEDATTVKEILEMYNTQLKKIEA